MELPRRQTASHRALPPLKAAERALLNPTSTFVDICFRHWLRKARHIDEHFYEE
jgi:hypothetical protein